MFLLISLAAEEEETANAARIYSSDSPQFIIQLCGRAEAMLVDDTT